MNTCKLLIRLGVLYALPCDAGTLLRLVKEEANEIEGDKSSFYAAHFGKLVIDHDPILYPFFRILYEDQLTGYGVLFSNGVGRIMVSDTRESLIKAIKDLCTPCVCRAGHLLLQRFRVGSALECTCATSTLKAIQTLAEKTGQCPLSYQSITPFRVIQNHAIAVADQRLRISFPR